MDYIPRGELFAAWRQLDSFSENLVRIYIAELAMVLGGFHNVYIYYAIVPYSTLRVIHIEYICNSLT